ncbi:hypothetical protein Pcinc_028444 [Petrolisthes cinctipes]|uniref:Uncharacterized protein n=1 Tax=Petrolisthes cinctipes TaxID=88211 RepID=A0AAE1F2C9_PETCI|nr:hypothetical protein Pcinc_028444 [Petrolisthes cinctipes]
MFWLSQWEGGTRRDVAEEGKGEAQERGEVEEESGRDRTKGPVTDLLDSAGASTGQGSSEAAEDSQRCGN